MQPLPFTSVVAHSQLDATTRLVSEVRFAQAAEAAESVQWKPPEAAIGAKGSDWGKPQRGANLPAKASNPHGSPGALGIKVVMFLLFRSRLPAAVVRTGPAGTQRLHFRRVGSGVGAEYAPTPFTGKCHAQPSHKLRGRTITQVSSASRQYATNSAKAPVRTARSNPSLKRSANGRPPGPVWRYAVHFRQPGPGVLPSSPA